MAAPIDSSSDAPDEDVESGDDFSSEIVLKQLNKQTAAAAKKRLERQRKVLKQAEGEDGPLAIAKDKTEQVMHEYEAYVTGRYDELAKREKQLKTQLIKKMSDFFDAFDNIREASTALCAALQTAADRTTDDDVAGALRELRQLHEHEKGARDNAHTFLWNDAGERDEGMEEGEEEEAEEER